MLSSQVPSNIKKVLRTQGFVRVDGLRNDSGQIIKTTGKHRNTHGSMGDAGVCLVIEKEIWIAGQTCKKDAPDRRSVIDTWAKHLHLNSRQPDDFPEELHKEIRTSDLLQRLADPDYEPDYAM